MVWLRPLSVVPSSVIGYWKKIAKIRPEVSSSAAPEDRKGPPGIHYELVTY